jgi:hypothetical protein
LPRAIGATEQETLLSVAALCHIRVLVRIVSIRKKEETDA